MITARRVLSALALLAAMSAQGSVRAVLHAPHDGQVLRGGAQATVSWSATGLPPFIEEWEAFLSVDGGAYYAYRITPHLDLGQRTFAFEVPNVESDEVRILIRAGDERREIEIELPQTFVIEKDDARALATPHLEVEDEERGEPAREGDRGVIGWVDGDRAGTKLIERDALRPQPALRRARSVVRIAEPAEDPGVRAVSQSRPTSSRHTLGLARCRARSSQRHRSGRDVLLTYRRLNI